MSQNKMRVMMYLGPGQLELHERPIPRPGPDEILLRVRAATTCGTDLKTYRRGHPKIQPPTPFGHECAGDVVAVGSAVTQFRPGMRVVPHNTAPCNVCFYCKQGQQNLCEDLVYNFGSYAEYIVVPGPIVRLNTFAIPDRLSYAEAAVMEPLVSVVHGQRVLQIQPGERVAIIGAGGPVGLLHLQMSLRCAASQVIAVDLSDERLALAKDLGATATINPAREDPVSTICALTEGRGADVVIESAGAKEAWITAFESVRKGGRVQWFGGLKEGTSIDLDCAWIHYRELTLYGVYHGTPLDVLRAFDLIASGAIDVKPLISHELPLERVEDGLIMMLEGKAIKVAINPELPASG
jgi:L-iditol 2-dehydrogenase